MNKKVVLIVMLVSVAALAAACGETKPPARVSEMTGESPKTAVVQGTVSEGESGKTAGNSQPVAQVQEKNAAIESKIEPKTESKTEPKVESKIEPKVESSGNQPAVPKPESKAEPKMEPAKPAVEPKKTEAGVSTARAEALYKNNCLSCHGGKLEGGFGPGLQKIGTIKTKEQIMEQISNGSGDMPGFVKQLDKDAVEVLGTWLAAKK